LLPAYRSNHDSDILNGIHRHNEIIIPGTIITTPSATTTTTATTTSKLNVIKSNPRYHNVGYNIVNDAPYDNHDAVVQSTIENDKINHVRYEYRKENETELEHPQQQQVENHTTTSPIGSNGFVMDKTRSGEVSEGATLEHDGGRIRTQTVHNPHITLTLPYTNQDRIVDSTNNDREEEDDDIDDTDPLNNFDPYDMKFFGEVNDVVIDSTENYDVFLYDAKMIIIRLIDRIHHGWIV
jgi:hypothetical protein